jgi:hypothetical protein
MPVRPGKGAQALRSNVNSNQKAAPAQTVTAKFLKAKGLAALHFYLGFSPLFLLPGTYLLPGHPIAVLLIPLAALALTYVAGLFTGKRRRLAFLLAMLLQALLCASLLLPLNPWSAFLFLPCLVMMLLFMPALNRPLGLEWSTSQLSQGVVLHLIGQAVKGLPVLEGAGYVLSLFFSGYLIWCLFAFNRYVLLDASGAEQSPPVKLLQKNRRILAVFALIAILAANYKSFETLVLAVWDFLKRAFATILIWLSSLLPELAPTGDQGAQQGLDLSAFGEASEPSAFSQFLENVLTVLAVIVAALLLLFALRQLYRLIKKLMKNLMARIRDYSRAIGEGYTDKTESLLDWGEVARSAKERWESFAQRHKKPPAWESLSPKDKIRRVYALLIKRLKNTMPSLTAREALQSGDLSLPPDCAQQIATLYEQARYSDHPISPEDAANVRKSAGV